MPDPTPNTEAAPGEIEAAAKVLWEKPKNPRHPFTPWEKAPWEKVSASVREQYMDTARAALTAAYATRLPPLLAENEQPEP